MNEASHQFLKDLDKKLWTAADKLRANLDAAVYKHAVLGLIFLKYVSDSFAMRQREIEAQLRDPKSDYYLDPADFKSATSAEYRQAIHQELEERDYYTEKNLFWVPALARWKTLQDSAKLPPGTEIEVINGKKKGLPRQSGAAGGYKITPTGRLIDDALDAIEKENPNRAEMTARSAARGVPWRRHQFVQAGGRAATILLRSPSSRFSGLPKVRYRPCGGATC